MVFSIPLQPGLWLYYLRPCFPRDQFPISLNMDSALKCLVLKYPKILAVVGAWAGCVLAEGGLEGGSSASTAWCGLFSASWCGGSHSYLGKSKRKVYLEATLLDVFLAPSNGTFRVSHISRLGYCPELLRKYLRLRIKINKDWMCRAWQQ